MRHKSAATQSRYDASIMSQPTIDTALLTYAWHTNPSPLLASASVTELTSASLTLVVSCPDEVGSATVAQIEVVIPSDPTGAAPDPTSLAATAPTNASIVSSDPNDLWIVNPGDMAGSFRFTPKGGTATVSGQSLTISIPGVQVSTLVGTAIATVNEWAAATGDPPAVADPCSGTSQTEVPKFPQGFAVDWFDATTPAIGPDFGTTLSWSGSDGATYIIQYDDVAIPDPNDKTAKPLSPKGSLKIDQLQSDPTLFTLTVTAQANGATATLSRQTLVAVQRAKIEKFNAYPVVLGKGASTTLSWVTNADKLVLEDQPVTAPSHSQPFVVTDTADLTLTAWKGTDMTQAQAHVEVMPPVIGAFDVSLDGVSVTQPVNVGTTVTFTWDTTFAQTIAISPQVGTVSAESDPTTPVTTAVVGNTTFMLTCTGKGDPVTQSFPIFVIPKIEAGITADENANFTLTWTSQGATRMSLVVTVPLLGPSEPQDVPLNGSWSIGNSIEVFFTYTLTAYNDGVPQVSVDVKADIS